ncbi:MAG: hypothetical protein ACREPE_10505 [Lysobacter sp.]
MHPNPEINPVSKATRAVASTGSAAQATTLARDTQALEDYTLASLEYLDATAAHHRADAIMYRALAHAHRLDPFLVPSDRTWMARAADDRAESSVDQALTIEQRADRIRTQTPAAAGRESPMAVIVVTVLRDRIRQTARLVAGHTRSASRSWQRIGANSWKSRDPEWAEHDGRIGLELAEYMDALELPTRVAAMLPLPREGAV